MAQHDYVIANQSGAAFRSDLNNGLSAIVSQNSGSAAPSTTYAYMWWADTTTGLLKIRNAANSAWVTVGTLATTNLGLAPLASPTFTGTVTAPTFTASTGINIPLGSAGSPSLYFTGDANTGIYSPAADTLAFAEGGVEAMRIDSSSRLLVGTSTARSNFYNSTNSPQLQIEGNDNSKAALAIIQDFNANTLGAQLVLAKNNSATIGTNVLVDNGDTLGVVCFQGNDGSEFVEAATIGAGVDGTPGTNDMPGRLVFSTTADGASSPTERMRINSSGNVGIGTTSPAEKLDVSGGNIRFGQTGFLGEAGAGPYDIQLGPDPGTTYAVARNLAFYTNAASAASTERARIDSNGVLLVGNTTPFATSSSTETGSYFTSAGAGVHYASGATALFIGRQTNDGTLVSFLQAGTAEGTISVSGTTVSYNGAHLSRWSQLPSGAERTEILRGSVLSNIDEMCEWGDEENEQLNRMKVSDVEGDKNVSGVFQDWDDDDDTYTDDFYCAMTGDFIIRIAEGVTVERGDLLMSAGDGTAKPQDHDVIRSKTIAKVTSTNVSCTYEDGSYCVPCVLMAC